MDKVNKNWGQTEELSNNFWIYLLFLCTRLFNRKLIVSVLLPVISLFYVLFARKPKRSSLNYLQRVLNRKPGIRDVYRHFHTFAVTSVDRIYILAGNFKGISFSIKDEERFKKTIEYPGALLITSHLGSYDIMRVMGTRDLDLPIHILIDKNHNARAIALLQTLDPLLAERVIDAGQTGTQVILKMQSVVSAGGMVGIMADRASKDNRIFKVNFLGKTVSLPMGPWIFAYLLDVPIILCFGLLDSDHKYHIYIEDIKSEQERSRSSRDELIEEWIKAYIKRLEYYVRIAPYNWFNFYDYWEDEST